MLNVSDRPTPRQTLIQAGLRLLLIRLELTKGTLMGRTLIVRAVARWVYGHNELMKV